MSITLAILRELTLEYADMEASEFRDTDALDRRINLGWAELYDLLVKQHEDYFIDETDITVVSGDGTYSLAAISPAVKMLRGVSLLLSDTEGDELVLQPFQWSERGQFAQSSPSVLDNGGRDLRYCLRGQDLILRPLPDAGATVRVHYVPRCTTLVVPGVLAANEIDELPSVCEPGWEEFIARAAAASLLTDEQNPDAAYQTQLKERVRVRIEQDAAPRDEDAPREIVRRVSYEDT